MLAFQARFQTDTTPKGLSRHDADLSSRWAKLSHDADESTLSALDPTFFCSKVDDIDGLILWQKQKTADCPNQSFLL